jgi:hypothetical protein
MRGLWAFTVNERPSSIGFRLRKTGRLEDRDQAAANRCSSCCLCSQCVVPNADQLAGSSPQGRSLGSEYRSNEPVNGGGHKQLFVDRYIVAQTDGVDLTVMPPERSPDNPCFCPDKNADQGHGMIPDTVLYDSTRHVYRLWYTSLEGNADNQYPGYAESGDGVHWSKEILNLRDFHGSKANNLLNGEPGVVVFDSHETMAGRRYKRIFTVENSGGVGVGISFSPDGIHWTDSTHNPVLNHTGDTHSWLGWDEKSGRYIGYFRPKGERPDVMIREQKRRIGLSFSADAEHWTPVEPVLEADEHDPPGTEFYWLHAIRYQDVYVGLLSVLHMDNNLLDFRQPDPMGREQTVDMELVVSRDGVHWQRTNNRAAWLPLGRYQSWDDKTMWPAAPVVLDDEIRVYYSGWNLRHHLGDLAASYAKRDGRWRASCIGFATLRLDGWVAARSVGPDAGTLVTKTLSFTGSAVELNVNSPKGQVKVELLDANERLIPGFSATVRGNSLHSRVAFGKPLPQGPLRLRFTIQNAELYAFQFVD